MRLDLAYSTKVMPNRFLNCLRAVEESTDNLRKSPSFQRFSGFSSTASTSFLTISDT